MTLIQELVASCTTRLASMLISAILAVEQVSPRMTWLIAMKQWD